MDNEKIDKRLELIERQAEVDIDRMEMVEQLSLQDQKKFRVVEDCLSTMMKHGINAYIFANLPVVDDNSDRTQTVFQYNTLGALAKYDETGVVTEEWGDTMKKFHPAFWNSVLHLFAGNREILEYMGVIDEENPKVIYDKRLFSAFATYVMYMVSSNSKNYTKYDKD